MEEIWKDVPDFEGVYMVSSFGRLKSFHNNKHGVGTQSKILKGSVGLNGYISVVLRNPLNGISKRFLLHRLVASVFIPNIDNKEYVDHINTIRTDNRVSNLMWVSPQENCRNEITYSRVCKRLKLYGKKNRGSKNPSAKRVGQYDLDDNLLAEYNSIIEASEKTGLSYRRLIHNVNGEQKKVGFYKFKLM